MCATTTGDIAIINLDGIVEINESNNPGGEDYDDKKSYFYW